MNDINNKQISLPEIIMLVLITGTADLFGIFAGFSFAIPVIGQVLILMSFFISFFIWLIVQFWLIMKGIGVQQLWYTGGSLFDMLSGGAIPLQTPTLLGTIYLGNTIKEAVKGAAVGAVTGGGLPGAVKGGTEGAVKGAVKDVKE